MTYSCWRRLGAKADIAGKVLAGNTIVGVLPKEFTGSMFGVNGDVLVPLSDSSYTPASRTQRDDRSLTLLARLKPGTDRRQAQAEMATLSGQLAAAYPKEDTDRSAVVTRATLLPPDSIPTTELLMGALVAAVLLVLLIACANVANLLLAIAVGRRQEAAIKLALGAPRGRLIRDFLNETAIICVASGALGYAIAAAAMARYSSINIVLPMVGSFSFGLNLRIDTTVIALTVALMFLAILAAGLAPALYASAPALSQVLSGETAVGGTRKGVRRNILVIVQVAICTLVLVGMGLCERSLYNLRRVDPGFSARNLVAMMVYPKQEHAPQARVKELFADPRDQVSAMPGRRIGNAGVDLPLFGGGKEFVQFPDTGKKISAGRATVDPNYFNTLGIRLLAGRVFTSLDRDTSPESVVINHKMADMFWPGQDAAGKSILVGDPPRKVIVVGVVANGHTPIWTKPAALSLLRSQPAFSEFDRHQSPARRKIRACGSFRSPGC